MNLIHPRRYVRRCKRNAINSLFKLTCKMHHVKIFIGDNSEVHGCTVSSKGNGEIVIGNNCILKNSSFNFYGQDGKIIIRDHVVINARRRVETSLCVRNGSAIVIDDDCLLSNSIDISTTDWHCVLDESGEQINLEKDVFIGEHVWIGRKATICKGVSISPNSIVASCSVVTKPITESNVVIAGNPAVIKKRNINWK